jgi:hypothetical protein
MNESRTIHSKKTLSIILAVFLLAFLILAFTAGEVGDEFSKAYRDDPAPALLVGAILVFGTLSIAWIIIFNWLNSFTRTQDEMIFRSFWLQPKAYPHGAIRTVEVEERRFRLVFKFVVCTITYDVKGQLVPVTLSSMIFPRQEIEDTAKFLKNLT